MDWSFVCQYWCALESWVLDLHLEPLHFVSAFWALTAILCLCFARRGAAWKRSYLLGQSKGVCCEELSFPRGILYDPPPRGDRLLLELAQFAIDKVSVCHRQSLEMMKDLSMAMVHSNCFDTELEKVRDVIVAAREHPETADDGAIILRDRQKVLAKVAATYDESTVEAVVQSMAQVPVPDEPE